MVHHVVQVIGVQAAQLAAVLLHATSQLLFLLCTQLPLACQPVANCEARQQVHLLQLLDRDGWLEALLPLVALQLCGCGAIPAQQRGLLQQSTQALYGRFSGELSRGESLDQYACHGAQQLQAAGVGLAALGLSDQQLKCLHRQEGQASNHCLRKRRLL